MQQRDARPPIWDEDAARESLGGDAELAYTLLRELCAQLAQDRVALQAAYQRHDAPALIEEAHRIRGGSAYLGTLALNQALTRLCGLKPPFETQAVDQAVAMVETEIERLMALVAND